MATRIQHRRGDAAQWTEANPLLAHGEMGVEMDTKRFKFGNGVDNWNDLDYADSAIEAQLSDHVDSLTPHPAYDDMPSLQLLFENGLI